MKNPQLLAEAKDYLGRDEIPRDFDAFWDRELRNLKLPKDYRLIEKDFRIGSVVCYEIVFGGTNNGQVYARMVLPKDERYRLSSISMVIWRVVGIGLICSHIQLQATG